MPARTLGLSGFDRDEEALFRTQFEAAAVPGWALAAENDAAVLLIDLDSMYGQMTWLKAQGGARPIVAVTAGRADADFVLPRPVTADGLRTLLQQLGGGHARPAPVADVQARPVADVRAAPPKADADGPAMPSPADEAAPRATTAPRLIDHLTAGTGRGPVRLKNAEPPLLFDSSAGTYVGGSTLKPLAAHCQRPIDAADLEPVDAAEYASQAGQLGGTQPLARLRWLAALHGFDGRLQPELAQAGRFKLSKWLQSEREYPKHFRIATAMLKQPCTIDELAAASGAGADEVVDFINACHAIGLVESDSTAGSPGSADAARGGLMSRLRGR